MANRSRTKAWLILLPVIFLLSAAVFFTLPRAHGDFLARALIFLPPTRTLATDDWISLHITETPFQPLATTTPAPTQAFTPSATLTPNPTPTVTPSPTILPTETTIAIYNNTIYDSSPPADLPPEAAIEGIYGYVQAYNLTCESRSAVDWARFFGVDISEMEFQSALPLTDNPNTGFVGYYDGPMGRLPPAAYGVHAVPVAAALRQYGAAATALENFSFNDLRRQIAAGNPVLVWVIGNVWNGEPVIYAAANGTSLTVARYEHTVIVTGYDPYGVTVVDNDLIYWRSNEEFLSSWSVLGNMAIIKD